MLRWWYQDLMMLRWGITKKMLGTTDLETQGGVEESVEWPPSLPIILFYNARPSGHTESKVLS